MKKLLLFMLLFATPTWACDRIFGKYNQAKVVNFCLHTTDVTVGAVKNEAAVHASGDTYIMKDEGAEANTTNAFVDEGSCYSITLTSTEMQAARVTLNIEDQSTKTWADQCLVIETYGNASAEHAMDLDTATIAVSSVGTGAITDSSYSLPQLVSESTVTLGLASGGVIADDQFNGMLLNIADYTTRQTKAAVCILDSVNAGDTVVTKADISGLVVGAGGTADYYYITPDSRCALVPETTTIPSAGTMSLEDMTRVNYQLGVNKFYSTSAEQGWYRSDGTTVWSTRDLTDDGTTYNKTAQETDD